MTYKNILFIVADDLNAWIEPLGRHPDVLTPNLKRLAARGTVFTRAYCAAPYCNASRLATFTGCLPTTTGVYANEPFWEMPSRRRTYLEKLRSAGYHCFGAGKVFHGVFDYATAGYRQADAALWRDGEKGPALWDEFHKNRSEPMPPDRPLNGMFDFTRFDEVAPWNHHFDWGVLPPDREEDMPDRAVVDHVSAFLARPPDQPFFCAAGLYKPHLPWYVPRRFFDLYSHHSVSLPFVKSDDLDDVPALARAWAEQPADHETVLKHGQWRHAVHAYLAAISYCDALIGELLDALDRSPAAKDTAVVLWGDNGFHLGEKMHWRKFVLWEEATRVPLIMIAPAGHKGPPRIEVPVSLTDIFPTLFDLCGLADDDPTVDGMSLVPLMHASGPVRTKPAISTWHPGNHSVRFDSWRYTIYGSGGEELYDQSADPHEWNNLIADARYGGVRERGLHYVGSLDA